MRYLFTIESSNGTFVHLISEFSRTIFSLWNGEQGKALQLQKWGLFSRTQPFIFTFLNLKVVEAMACNAYKQDNKS